MKLLIRSILLTILTVSSVMTTTAFAASTGWRTIERIQTTDAGITYVRPQGLGTFGGDGCPNATYAYIESTKAGYDTIVNLMIASKLNNTPMIFYGTCDAAGVYVHITYALLL